jgi:hypothetical protein
VVVVDSAGDRFVFALLAVHCWRCVGGDEAQEIGQQGTCRGDGDADFVR